MQLRTNNGGYVSVGSGLSITNGVTREVRGLILEREGRDKERRKAYRKRPAPRIGSKADAFTTFSVPEYLR